VVDKVFYEESSGGLSDMSIWLSDGQMLSCFNKPCISECVSMRDIDRIEVTFGKAERFVYFITIVYRNKTVTRLGKVSQFIKPGRVEQFQLFANEQVLGMEMYCSKSSILGVRWFVGVPATF
jgi:hypothetical protein